MLNTFVLSPSLSEPLPGSDDLDFLRLPDELTETPSGSSLWFPPASVYGLLPGPGEERDECG